MTRPSLLLASTILMSLNISANEIYIVKNGDTLTDILYSKDYKHIYGKRGVLQETLDLNPAIKKNNGNKIFPNMQIILTSRLPSKDKLSADSRQQTVILPINHETHLGESATEPKKETIAKSTLEFKDQSSIDNFKQAFYWEFSPTLSWKSLDSTDENVYRRSSVSALSNLCYGVSTLYGMRFEENLDIYSRLSLESVGFVQNATINLIKKNFLATRFGMGISYRKNWQFEVAMSDEYFLTSPKVSTVDIIKVAIPELKMSYLKDFYHVRNAKLSYSIAGKAFHPRTSPEIDSKLGYGVGGAIEARLFNQLFKIGYDVNLLEATGNSTKYQNIFWKYTWENL